MGAEATAGPPDPRRTGCTGPPPTAVTPSWSTGPMRRRDTGFDPEARVVVQQHDDTEWIVWESFRYRAHHDTFTVPRGSCTDFASVPRPFVWYLPTYGAYTLAAILHDHLWRDLAATGALSYHDADGIFRRAMRELDVPFLHRWVMWAAVRWAALVKPGGTKGWSADAPLVVAVTAVALPFVVAPATAVLVATVKLHLLERALWVPLRLHAWWGARTGRPARKRVVAPRFELRAAPPNGDGCPPVGWDRPLAP